MSEADGRKTWPLDSKNARKPARSSAVVRMGVILGLPLDCARFRFLLRDASAEGTGTTVGEWTNRGYNGCNTPITTSSGASTSLPIR